jgi:hypothetical protein
LTKHHAKPKSFEETVSALLDETKSQIEAIEESTKGKLAQADADAIKSLRTTRHQIDKKSQELRTAGEADAARIKAEIEADMAKFKASLEQFGTKLKSRAATK